MTSPPLASMAAIEQLAARAAADPAVRALALDVTRGRAWTDQAGAALALLTWVQTSVRYRNDPAGIDVYQDHTYTIAYREGDCAAQTVLLLGLLRAAGIESYATFVDYGGGIEHVLVTAYPTDGAPIYLDPIAYWHYPGSTAAGTFTEYRPV